MSRKIFITYKYGDTSVLHLQRSGLWGITTVRDYVTELQDMFEKEDEINKGELDGQDLSEFKDSTIESKLRAKIYDSSLTIVMISKNMRDYYIPESDQWIPWEISYSLREPSRNGRTSKTNAMLAVVLPDVENKYEYYLIDNMCCEAYCRTILTQSLFGILKNNMFNMKKPITTNCPSAISGTVYHGESSYIPSVKWIDFISDYKQYVNRAIALRDRIDDYNIVKQV